MQQFPFFLSVLSGIVIALISLMTAFIAAKIAGNYQVKVANINASKDIQMQRDRIWDERSKKILSEHLERLQSIHTTLSDIAFENSRTMSSIQQSTHSDVTMQIAAFREIYLKNCEKLHRAEAIVGIFYPTMTNNIRKINGLTNLFYHYQEVVLRIERSEKSEDNHNLINTAMHDVIDTINKLDSSISITQSLIEDTAKDIQKQFQYTFSAREIYKQF